MVFENLECLYKKYDSFLIDVYGVLYDGLDFYSGAIDLLGKMKKEGKKLIILSNTTLVEKTCNETYSKKGLIEGIHYDRFLSSGEIFKQNIFDYLTNAKSYFNIFDINNDIFLEGNLIRTNTIETADFVYVGSVKSKGKVIRIDNLKIKDSKNITVEDLMEIDWHEIEGLEEITDILDKCFKSSKTLVIVNPDIFAIESINGDKSPILCQGAVGDFYERIGGKVLYFGKPYKSVYDYAKKLLVNCDKTAMVGDTLWTDILGGNMANIDTILTLTGVSGQFAKSMDDSLSIEDKIKNLIEKISPKMTHKSFKNISQIPTYIIERFA